MNTQLPLPGAGLTIIEEKTLSTTETSRLDVLESAIEENFLGFVVVGMALSEINEHRLYRNNKERTFDQYCSEIWDINARRAYQFIHSALVVENVKNFTQSNPELENVVAPKNEAQAKELAGLPPEDQVSVWQAVIEESTQSGGKITASKVKKAVSSFKGETFRRKIKKAAITSDDNNENGPLVSEGFNVAWDQIWHQIEAERKSNWRYTSKALVHERLTILLEALEESGLKAQQNDKAEI